VAGRAARKCLREKNKKSRRREELEGLGEVGTDGS
jgi:hypothetical protein